MHSLRFSQGKHIHVDSTHVKEQNIMGTLEALSLQIGIFVFIGWISSLLSVSRRNTGQEHKQGFQLQIQFSFIDEPRQSREKHLPPFLKV